MRPTTCNVTASGVRVLLQLDSALRSPPQVEYRQPRDCACRAKATAVCSARQQQVLSRAGGGRVGAAGATELSARREALATGRFDTPWGGPWLIGGPCGRSAPLIPHCRRIAERALCGRSAALTPNRCGTESDSPTCTGRGRARASTGFDGWTNWDNRRTSCPVWDRRRPTRPNGPARGSGERVVGWVGIRFHSCARPPLLCGWEDSPWALGMPPLAWRGRRACRTAVGGAAGLASVWARARAAIRGLGGLAAGKGAAAGDAGSRTTR